jgi:hypothetical protein
MNHHIITRIVNKQRVPRLGSAVRKKFFLKYRYRYRRFILINLNISINHNISYLQPHFLIQNPRYKFGSGSKLISIPVPVQYRWTNFFQLKVKHSKEISTTAILFTGRLLQEETSENLIINFYRYITVSKKLISVKRCYLQTTGTGVSANLFVFNLFEI